ncbi:MAG: hypothetical protein K0R29_2334 [Pseudobdellovibrio sp.]|jgi:hypothetical protein|nr:hypothetical protein [Pseudobdellovibrio sp.]
MKAAIFLTVLFTAFSGFAITNTRAKCQVQGTDLSFVVVRSQTSAQTLHYVNGRLALVMVAEGNWPDEAGVLHVLNANGTVKSVLICERAQ